MLPKMRTFNARAFFDAVRAALVTRAETAKAFGGVVVFAIDDTRFVVDLERCEVVVTPADAPIDARARQAVACVVTTSERFEQLVHGKLSVHDAVASGTIAAGDARAFEALAVVMQP
jgi:hypothetical protein